MPLWIISVLGAKVMHGTTCVECQPQDVMASHFPPPSPTDDHGSCFIGCDPSEG